MIKCTVCDAETDPSSIELMFETRYGLFNATFKACKCEKCGNVWATKEQRQYNSVQYKLKHADYVESVVNK